MNRRKWQVQRTAHVTVCVQKGNHECTPESRCQSFDHDNDFCVKRQLFIFGDVDCGL